MVFCGVVYIAPFLIGEEEPVSLRGCCNRTFNGVIAHEK